MPDETFFNLNDLSQGIHRVLSEGLETRVFPGDQSMLSIVRAGPNKAGSVHSHPEEQWGILLEGSGVRTQGGVEHGFTAGPVSEQRKPAATDLTAVPDRRRAPSVRTSA